MSEERIDPGHKSMRGFCRILGPILAVTGVIFIIIAIVSFFTAFNGGGPPKYFWCFFIGGPIWFVGMVLCKFGYMGKMARYVSGEMSPVVKDTFNYMADGTQESVKNIASAIGEGLGLKSEAGRAAKTRCHKCGSTQDADAKFCDDCGAALIKNKTCPACSELNDADAKYCKKCGHALSR